jgi:hypothetical protein
VYWENKMSFYISCVWNEYCILFTSQLSNGEYKKDAKS